MSDRDARYSLDADDSDQYDAYVDDEAATTRRPRPRAVAGRSADAASPDASPRSSRWP